MLCQSCGKRNATAHIKNIVNGEMTEYYLCSECAARTGYGNLTNSIAASFHDMLSAVLNRDPAAPETERQETRCEGCGCTFSDIAQNGRVGCPACYTRFRDRLLPAVQRVHGNSRYVGRVPVSASKRAKLEIEIDEARKQLAKAIEEENFEEAVRLRDMIRSAEEEEQKEEN